MKLSNNSSFVILILEILTFRHIDRSTFSRSKFWPPPNVRIFTESLYTKIKPRNIYFFIFSKRLQIQQ